MNALDGVVVVVVLLAGIGGWRFGFVARMLAWCGIAIALVVGFHFVPRVVTSFGGTSADDRVTVAVLFLVLVATLGQTAGFGLGVLAHRPSRTTRTLPTWDRVTGATVGVLGVIMVTWILAPARVREGLVGAPSTRFGGPRSARRLQPRATTAVRGVGAHDLGCAVSIGVVTGRGSAGSRLRRDEPDPSPVTCERVERSTRPRREHACGWLVRGTGWVVATGLVVTNAHVVAGESETTVEDSSGREHEADLVLFDPNLDLALLRVRRAQRSGAPTCRRNTGPGDWRGVWTSGRRRARHEARVRWAKPTATVRADMYGPGYVERAAC